MRAARAISVAAVLALVAVALAPQSAAAENATIVWGISGSPYHVTGALMIPAGTTLVIEDGVTVLMGARSALQTLGPLEIRGGALGVDFLADGPAAPSFWNSVYVFGGGMIRGAHFESANQAVVAYSPLLVEDSSFSGNSIGAYAAAKRMDLNRVSSTGNAVGFYWDHAPGSITDADISGGTWGIYLYAPLSDVQVTRANVHHMRFDSYAITSINNKPVIRESVLGGRISLYLPACASDALVIDTWMVLTYACYYNRIAVWNKVRAGTFFPGGAPAAGSDVAISDLSGPKYASPGLGGSDPATGPDGWAGRVLLMDWTWVPGKKTVNTALVTAARGGASESRSVDVSYRLDVPFEVVGNEPPVAVIDVFRTVDVELRVTGKPGNAVRAAHEEDGTVVQQTVVTRTAGPPNVATMELRFHEGSSESLRLTHLSVGNGANPVHLTVSGKGGSWGANILMNSKGGVPDEAVVDLSEALAVVLNGDRSYVFDGSGSHDPDGSVVVWTWDFGDGTSASGTVVEHEFAAAGTYTVVLTVTDDGGASGSAQSVVVVS